MTARPWIDDQARAAAREAETLVFDHAWRYGLVPTTTDSREGFAGRLLTDLLARFAAGTVRTCGHLHNPAVMHAAAWRPDEILCAMCALLSPRLSDEADRTCDMCGQVVPLISPNLAQVGAVVFAYGLCRPCARADARATERPGARGRRKR